MRPIIACILIALFFVLGLPAYGQPAWQRLPPTPSLPKAQRSGTAAINGIQLWYAVFGQGSPIVLVHGGLANANYWGHQIPILAKNHEVIVLDSRGHGRSTRTKQPIGYDLMSSDVLGIMDFLHIKKAALIGWSDGAIIGLDIAIHHPDRLTKLFAFAANSDPSGVKDVSQSPVFNAYIKRAKQEYRQLSPTPNQFHAFLQNISHMWASQPHFTVKQLSQIEVPTWIVDGDHDEAIKRSNTDYMFHHIPGAQELILPGVSHFAFLQRPDEFNAALLRFLQRGHAAASQARSPGEIQNH